jgi:hypothetical protein
MTVLADGGISGGTVGFLVVLALVVAAVFLFRSMLKHLRKVPPSFDHPESDTAASPPRAESAEDRPPDGQSSGP